MAFNVNIPGPKIVDLDLFGKLSSIGTSLRENADEAMVKSALADLRSNDPTSMDEFLRKIGHMPKYAEFARKLMEDRAQAANRAGMLDVARGNLGVARGRLGISQAEETRAAEDYKRGLTEDAASDARLEASRAARAERRRRREAGEVVPPVETPVPTAPGVQPADDVSRYWPKPQSALEAPGRLASTGGIGAELSEEELAIMPDAGAKPSQAPVRYAQATGATRTDALPELPPPDAVGGRPSNELIMPQMRPLTVGPGPTRPQPAPALPTPAPPAPAPSTPAPASPATVARVGTPVQRGDGPPQLRPPSQKEQDLEEEADEYMELAGRRGISTTRANIYKAKAMQLRKDAEELMKQRERLWQGEYGAYLKREEGKAQAESAAAKKMKEAQTETGSALQREADVLGNLRTNLESGHYLSGQNLAEFRSPNIPGIGKIGFDFPTPGKAIEEASTRRIEPIREFYKWATGEEAPGARISEPMKKVAQTRANVEKQLKESVILRAPKGSIGAQGFTDKDRDYVEAVVGNKSDQRDVLLARVNAAIAVNDRKKVEEEIKNAMLRDGRTTSEITHSIREYNKANPLFRRADGSLTEAGRLSSPALGDR